MIVDLTEARNHGICDRLRAVTYFMAVARLVGDDRIDLHEPFSKFCPYRLCDSVILDGLELRHWEGPLPQTARKLSVTATPTLEMARRYPPADVAVSAEIFYRFWLDAYTHIQPNARIRAHVDGLALTRRTIGVHVRRTDKLRSWPGLYDLTPGESVRAERAMEQLIRREADAGRIDSVFLASDSAEGKADWTARVASMGLPLSTHAATFHTAHWRQTNSTDFFVDLFALARCGIIVGNVRSGVGFSARLMGGVAEFHTMSDAEQLVNAPTISRIAGRIRRRFFRE